MTANKILVPIGIGKQSRELVLLADKLAKRVNSKIIFLHVTRRGMEYSIWGTSNNGDEKFTQHQNEVENSIKKFLKTLKISSPYEFIHETGIPYMKIMEMAMKGESAYIVMGAHDHNAFERILLGSSADYVLHHSRIPMYIAKPVSGLNEKLGMVPMDFTDINAKVAQVADSWAQWQKGSLTFVHIDCYLPYYHSWAPEMYGSAPSIPREEMDKSLTKLKKKTENYVEKLGIQSPYKVEVRAGASAGPVLFDIWKEIKPGWTFTASHSHTIVERFLLGSVTDYLMHHFHGVLYVHRSPD